LQNFDAKPDWNRLFMRSTLEWEVNIKIDLREIGI
jgi:hypothetical protein